MGRDCGSCAWRTEHREGVSLIPLSAPSQGGCHRMLPKPRSKTRTRSSGRELNHTKLHLHMRVARALRNRALAESPSSGHIPTHPGRGSSHRIPSRRDSGRALRGFEPRHRLLGAAELRRYRGAPGDPGLYLALLGRVFDVQSGRRHYGPGGAYSALAGRDATRAFATGDFSESGLVDDVSALSPQELLSIQGWLSFYREHYEPVGKLVGRFYDENGAPTEALREAEAAIEEALKFQAESEQRKQQFPPCNSEWSSAKGTRFWCSTESGGVSRGWAGVPRRLYRPGSRGSGCVCVRSTGPPWGHPPSSQHSDRGDLDDPHLQEYEGCPPLAEQCVLPG